MKITLHNTGKRFGKSWIFRNRNEVFESPGTYAICGFNGSGKSTLLQMLSGYISPSEGSLTFALGDAEIDVEQLPSMLAIAAPYVDLLEEFTVAESIALHGQLKPFRQGISNESVLEQCALTPHRDKFLHELSSGMRQRLKLALAIFSDTPILLLDEPCANLDARWAAWFAETLSIHSHQRLVIISSNSQENELSTVNRSILDLSLPG